MGTPELPARSILCWTLMSLCMNRFAIGMNVTTCRNTPTSLFIVFFATKAKSSVSATIFLVLAIFLCGIDTVRSVRFQSMPTACIWRDQVVNLPSCQPSDPNTSLIASLRRCSARRSLSPMSTSMQTMSSTHWNIQKGFGSPKT
ncbi:hypothetical protein PF002_g31282 [Phytophthora fragariae]|uniref:Secreted protein n=2 Tax=Phytophthora fragariae TaxID=53985 RepID=A0A6A3DM82_9STRA|nr:hypothetical protein PF003_g13019 [Phytophthora fragariae]KAE8921523.1 hypothetical protein PF009_g28202 [Phytophthora fragariae]KAE9062008.1 hypothetical protein PF007_g30062 [Phytophthora fragariae]KAE9165771.1 hypothetical protein PF002_g31282 [Phytophthora fragariae]KAE9269978.1 hypothetical protein PF001_g28989 [Phytophthora fragariae]